MTRSGFVTFLAGFSLVLLASPAGAGEQAFGQRVFGSAQLDGYKGTQAIRTDPPTVNGIGYVHASQMDVGSQGAAFVAIGTAKGVGVDNCANDYDPKWSVYVDGEIGGTYFCDDVDLDAWGDNTTPSFSIIRGACQGAERWIMKFEGVTEACLASGADGSSRAIGMLETTGPGTVDRNIDVIFKHLNLQNNGSTTWYNFGTPSFVIAPSYERDHISSTAFAVYEPPLA